MTVEEALESLCLAYGHGEAGLSDAILAVLVRKRSDSYDIRTGLLGGVVTVDTKAEALCKLSLIVCHAFSCFVSINWLVLLPIETIINS